MVSSASLAGCQHPRRFGGFRFPSRTLPFNPYYRWHGAYQPGDAPPHKSAGHLSQPGCLFMLGQRSFNED